MTVEIGRTPGREGSLSDRVAEHIMERMLDRTLSGGTRLPSERLLAEQYGVSRTVIREAVRTLSSKGLLETRGGSGSYVRRVDATTAGPFMAFLLRLNHGGAPVPYQKIHEVRRMLEVEIVALAAQRATSEDIEALQRAVKRHRHAEDPSVAASADAAFHAMLALATHNELFPVLLNSISNVMTEVRQRGLMVADSSLIAVEQHAQILEAVIAHDVVAASEAMAVHLHFSKQVYLRSLDTEVDGALVET